MTRRRWASGLVLLLVAGAAARQPGGDASAGPATLGSRGFRLDRDAYGTPRITAASAYALYRGQGYAMAQDRLWQLETYRRSGRGTLADILGPDYLSHDRFVHRQDYTAGEYRAMYEACSPLARTALDGYAAGVNDWIEEVARDPERLLPGEFWRHGCRPGPWSAADLQAIVKYLGRTFGSQLPSELERLEALQLLGLEEFERRYPLNDPEAPTTIRAGDMPKDAVSWGRGGAPCRTAAPRLALDPSLLPAAREEAAAVAAAAARLGVPHTFGSFGVAVGPSRAAGGRAMLLGGPQPGVLHRNLAQFGAEVRLSAPGLDVAGYAMPGIPGVLVGCTPSVAWTFTSGLSDNVDLFIEQVNPRNPEQYRFRGQWRSFESRADTIRVLGEPQEYVVRRSLHGPLGNLTPRSRQAVSFRAAWWKREMEFLESVLRLNAALDLAEVNAAVSLNPYSWNVLCATGEGDIGYWHTGLYQDRLDGVDPRLPRVGTGEEEWHGLRAVSTLPRAVNPAAGYFANWNNKPSPDWENGDHMVWTGPHRVETITRRLDEGVLDLDSLMALHRHLGQRGCYEQVVEWSSPPRMFNILPPGQSGFVSRAGVEHRHFGDQWGLFQAGGFKPWAAGGAPAPLRETEPLPSRFTLEARPNPASGAVEFRLPDAAGGLLALEVYDTGGRRVRRLEGGEALSPGGGLPVWDGRDAAGRPAPSGVYFARALLRDGSALTRKITLAR